MTSIVCPSCGAPIHILNKEVNNECSFCGTKLSAQMGIDLVNEQIEEFEYDETKKVETKSRRCNSIWLHK